jgi:hypothetical protein
MLLNRFSRFLESSKVQQTGNVPAAEHFVVCPIGMANESGTGPSFAAQFQQELFRIAYANAVANAPTFADRLFSHWN